MTEQQRQNAHPPAPEDFPAVAKARTFVSSALAAFFGGARPAPAPAAAEAERSSTEMAALRTEFASRRTLMASDRTLMAWLRTALSMISFGFTIYKLLQGFEAGAPPSPTRAALAPWG